MSFGSGTLTNECTNELFLLFIYFFILELCCYFLYFTIFVRLLLFTVCLFVLKTADAGSFYSFWVQTIQREQQTIEQKKKKNTNRNVNGLSSIPQRLFCLSVVDGGDKTTGDRDIKCVYKSLVPHPNSYAHTHTPNQCENI